MTGPGTTGHGELRYEKTDAEPRALFRFAAVLLVGVLAASATAFGLLAYLARVERRSDPPPPPLGRRDPGQLPPEPRLQTDPFGDLRNVRDEEERVLTHAGWVDRQAGVARIPIDEAMRLVVQRGLVPAPAREAEPVDGAAGVPSDAAAPFARPSPSPGGRP